MLLRFDAEGTADKSLTGIESVTSLIEIIGLRIVVDILAYLVYAGQRVKYSQILFRRAEHPCFLQNSIYSRGI